MGTRVTLQGVRLSFPHLFQARAVQAGDDPKFGAAFLIPKNHPMLPTLQAAIKQEKANKWGANIPATASSTLYDGDTDPKYNTVADNHGCMILNTSSAQDQPPVLVDVNLQKVINPATFYAGCYVNADIGVYGYDKGVSKGIAAGLNGVQFVQDGERLDSRPSAEDMFGAPAGAPPPIAGGDVGQPVQQPVNQMAQGANPYAQPVPAQGAPYAPPVGGQPAQTAVAPSQAGAPPAGNPSFLG